MLFFKRNISKLSDYIRGHLKGIEQSRQQVTANSLKKGNDYTIVWSVVACLVIGFGIQNQLVAMNKEKQSLNKVVVSQPSNKDKLHAPQPVVGRRKYKKYLEDHLIRPTDKPCKDVKGKVTLSFFVDKKGNPQRIVVIKSLCKSADKEAIRLIKEGPKWTHSILPVEIKVKF